MDRRYKILIIAQNVGFIDAEVKYGASRAVIEIAKYLASKKLYQVYVAGLSDRQLPFINEQKQNIQYLLVENKNNLEKYIKYNIKHVDILIQTSELDYITSIKATKYLVYQHNPCSINIKNISAIDVINLFKISILCVSSYSRQQQINYGINENLINVVHNGYDSSIFFYKESKYRHPLSIIFAGNVVDYKGVDIALKAFIQIKKEFPEAIFNICGSNHSWQDIKQHYFKTEWLDSDGFPVWSKIELEISGVKYLGELSQSDLAEQFRQHSLLITPSRIGETFGLVSIESQACGCIPILPNRGGFSETLQDRKTGYLYEDNTPEAIANMIIDLWNRGLPTIEQRYQAQIWTQDNFSWEKAGATFLRIIETIPDHKTSLLVNNFSCLIIRYNQWLREKILKIHLFYKQKILLEKLTDKIFDNK